MRTTDYVDREIEKLSLVLKAILKQIIRSKEGIPELNEEIIVQQTQVNFSDLIDGSLEDFKFNIESFTLDQKEMILQIFNALYIKTDQDAFKALLKAKIIYMLDVLDLQTKTFSIDRQQIRNNL